MNKKFILTTFILATFGLFFLYNPQVFLLLALSIEGTIIILTKILSSETTPKSSANKDLLNKLSRDKLLEIQEFENIISKYNIMKNFEDMLIQERAIHKEELNLEYKIKQNLFSTISSNNKKIFDLEDRLRELSKTKSIWENSLKQHKLKNLNNTIPKGKLLLLTNSNCAVNN